MPKRGEPSLIEKDAHKAVESLMDRAKTASQRVAGTFQAVSRLIKALEISSAKFDSSMSYVVPFAQAAYAAESTLAHARAEASAARTRFESCSRPRRMLNFLKARWEIGVQPLDVDEAEWHVGEAQKALSSARAKSDRGWELVHEAFEASEAMLCKLRSEKRAHASAEKVLADLEAALVRAKDRAVCTASKIKVGRRLARETYVRGGDGGVDRLLGAARIAATLEDDSCGDQVWTSTVYRCSTSRTNTSLYSY